MKLNLPTIDLKNPKPRQIACLTAAIIAIPTTILVFFMGLQSASMVFMFGILLFGLCFTVILYAINFFEL